MLSFVFRKILNKRWMAISLLIGNLLLIAIAAASPMYSQAVLQRALMKGMGNYLTETNQYPGTIVVKTQYSPYQSIDDSVIVALGEHVFAFDEEMNTPSLEEVTRMSINDAKATPTVKVQGTKMDALELVSYSNMEDHIEVIHGELYTNEIVDHTFDVMVSENTLVQQNLSIGQELILERLVDENEEPYRVRISGVFTNKDEQDPYWVYNPSYFANQLLMPEELFRQLIVDRADSEVIYNLEWYQILDYTQMRSDNAEHLLDMTNYYLDNMKNEGAKYIRASYYDTLKKYVSDAKKLNTTILVLQVPIFVLLAAFIFMVSRQMLEMEQNEISVFKSRGASKAQIIQIYLIQSLLIAAAGLVGGIPIGVMICKMIGASNDFLSFVQRTALPVELGPNVLLMAGGAALFSIATMVLPVFRFSGVTIVNYKRAKNRKGKSWWKTIFLDVILLAYSLYSYWQFKGQEDYLAAKVVDGASLDPMLYFNSSLFILGCGLLFLRLLPLLIKLIFWAGKKLWPPAIYASFLRILRANDNQGFLVVFLVLTISMGIFDTQMARTINANSEEKMQYLNGADIVVQEIWSNNSFQVSEDTTGLLKLTYAEPDFSKYKTMEGIESATKVLVEENGTVFVPDGKIKGAMLMGIHTKEFGETAWFKDSLLPAHWYEYLNAMSTNSHAVLVSSNFRDNYGYQIGDAISYANNNGDSARGVIYGFVDYWPGYAPKNRTLNSSGLYTESDHYLVVAHLSQMQSYWGVTPYQVWIKAKDSTQFMYDYAAETGTKFPVFKDTTAELITLKNDPVFQGTNGILTIGFIIVLVLCCAGFLIYWILSIQSRTLQFGIYRAMGMSQGEVLSMLINEQFFISGISIAAGVLVGLVSSKLFVPLIQIAYSASDKVIPLEIISSTSDFIRLGSVIGIMLVICMVILGMLISKIRISQALKLGED